MSVNRITFLPCDSVFLMLCECHPIKVSLTLWDTLSFLKFFIKDLLGKKDIVHKLCVRPYIFRPLLPPI